MNDLEWLTINYTLPKEPSRTRVSVWRRLKKSGAVLLCQSVWVLPVNRDNETFLKKIADDIKQNGGNSYIMQMTSQDKSTSERIVSVFNQARDEEYSEFLEQCDQLLNELEKESKLGKFTFAELEENENDLQKLSDWQEKIKMRDFYNGSLRCAADEKLKQCEARLDLFITEVYRQNDEESK